MFNKKYDSASQSSFEDDSRKLKIKVEPNASPACHTNTDAGVTKHRSYDTAKSSSGTASSQSGVTPAIRVQNEEPTCAPNRGESLPTITTKGSPAHRSPPIPPLYMTQASITSQTITDQSRPLIQPVITPPRYIHNSHKLGWMQRQKEVKKILKQRSQEWKEKQSLYQLMRTAAASQNSLMGDRKRGKNHMLHVRGRGNHHTGNEVMPRTAFNLYPGYVNPTSYPGIVYPVPPECNPKLSANSDSAFKRRYSNGVSPLGEEKLDSAGHHEPVIKEVVSLANTSSSNIGEENEAEPRRSKRVRKITDEPACPERQESVDSETNGDSSTTGKYISDFAEVFQNTPGDHQVAHINGLLSLPSSRETRYGITYGELKRRCGAPEHLTRVDLVAYVRHSKSSGRSLLDKYKIVSENRSSRPTILSKMCENEARVLGDGILRMNMDYFPSKILAEIATERLKEGLKDEEKQEKLKNDIKVKMRHIETTRSMLKEAFDLLQSEKDHQDMRKFELASHTFGTVNLKNHLTLFDRFFQEYQTSLMGSLKGLDFEA